MRLGQATVLGLLIGSLSLPALAAESRRFELSVLVDGSLLPEYPWQGKTYLEAERGRSFTLRVSNPTPERIAVAISVDGRNVVDAKRTGERQATKWVLEPWQTVEIPGWQVSGSTARRFFFTETARSYAKWLGDTANVGTIEAVFFRGRDHVPPITLEQPRKNWETPKYQGGEGPAPEYQGGALGDPRDGPARAQSPEPNAEAKREARPAEKASPHSTREGVHPYGYAEPSDSYAATGIGERTHFPVQWVRFDEDPAPAARITLRYEFRRELLRLGVLPRGTDDLWAREHGRGFAPEYAPDPDRHRSQ